MTPLRTERSVLDVLVWLPGCFYAVWLGIMLARAAALSRLDAVAGPLLGAVAFLLLAGAHRAQARRLDRLERALLERSQLARSVPAGPAGATR